MIEETENNLVEIETKDRNLNDEVSQNTENVVNNIVAVEDQDEFKRLVALFNLNQSKKNALRILKLNGLQEKIDNQIIERFEKRPDQMSNSELLEYLKTIENSIDRSQKYVEKIEDKPMIQIVQPTTINIESPAIIPLSRDEKQKVLDLVDKIINESRAEVIDIPSKEENEDDEEDMYYGEDVYYSEGEGEDEW